MTSRRLDRLTTVGIVSGGDIFPRERCYVAATFLRFVTNGEMELAILNLSDLEYIAEKASMRLKTKESA